MGVASVPLTPSGYDSEFAPLREESRENSKKLWSLPYDEFIKVWETIPPAIPEGCPSLEEIDVRHEDVPVRDGAKVDVQIYRPKSAEKSAALPMFFVMHGGGWVVGSHSMEEATNRYVCVENQCVVVSVLYRKAPEFKFPHGLNDSFDVLQWCRQNASNLSIDTSRIIVGGGSAGGNLAAALALKLRDENLLKGVIGQVLNIPVTCHPKCTDEAAKRFKDSEFKSYEENKDAEVVNAADMHWFWNHYTTTDIAHPYASPLLAESHANLPPALVQVAGKDPLRDEALAYAKALQGAGVQVTLNLYPGLPHGFYMFPTLTQAKQCHAEEVDFIKGSLGQMRN